MKVKTVHLHILIICIFTFSNSYIIEKAFFIGSILEAEFLIKLHIFFLKSTESENQVFNSWSVLLFISYKHN